eukprot:9480541-Pyramimonas_sp.AAC.1
MAALPTAPTAATAPAAAAPAARSAAPAGASVSEAAASAPPAASAAGEGEAAASEDEDSDAGDGCGDDAGASEAGELKRRGEPDDLQTPPGKKPKRVSPFAEQQNASKKVIRLWINVSAAARALLQSVERDASMAWATQHAKSLTSIVEDCDKYVFDNDIGQALSDAKFEFKKDMSDEEYGKKLTAIVGLSEKLEKLNLEKETFLGAMKARKVANNGPQGSNKKARRRGA